MWPMIPISGTTPAEIKRNIITCQFFHKLECVEIREIMGTQEIVLPAAIII